MIKHVKFVLELDQRLYIVDEIIYNNYDQNIFYYINKCIKRAHTHNRDHFWNKLKRIFVMTVGWKDLYRYRDKLLYTSGT